MSPVSDAALPRSLHDILSCSFRFGRAGWLRLLLALALLGGGPIAWAEPAAVISADGRLRAWVSAADEVWLSEADGQPPRRLLAARPDDDPRRNLSGFNNLAFSPDGRALYVLTEAWVTSNALHRIALDSGQIRFITDANAVEVIAKGRLAGHLMVQKHKYFPQGGSYEAWFLISPTGREIARLGTGPAAPDPHQIERKKP